MLSVKCTCSLPNSSPVPKTDPTACKKRVNCDSVTSYTGFQAAIDSGVIYDKDQLSPDEDGHEWDGESDSRSESRHLMWSNGHSLDRDSIELEVKMYRILSQRWNKQQQHHSTVNVTLNLETDSGHLLSVATSATLNWPKLVSVPQNLIQFPLTKYGSSSRRDVFIENPSSHPLSIQALVIRPALYPEDFVASLSSGSAADVKDMDSGNSFKISILHPDDASDVPEFSSVSPVITIPVGQRIRVSIFFQPQPKNNTGETSSSSSSSSGGNRASSSRKTSHQKQQLADAWSRITGLLLIRNNLTIFDSLRLAGESGQALLRIGKDAPGLTSMLTLDLTDKHVNAKCRIRNSKAASASPVQASVSEKILSFQRDFMITNFGKIPVTVRGFLIGPHAGVSSSSYKSKSTLASLSDEPIGSNNLLANLMGKSHCEGFGFRILNCGLKLGKNDQSLHHNNNKSISNFEPFTLEPNASRKISISFTPDFTIAKSLATLTVITDEGPHEDEVSRNWTEVLQQHFLPSPSVIAMGTKWLSILTTGSSASTPMQKWVWRQDSSSRSRTSDQPVPDTRPMSRSSSITGNNNNNNKPVTRMSSSGLNLITYSLIATVPKNLLSVCDHSLPRPYQEMILYYTQVVVMICLVMVTCAFAFIDGTRVLNFSFYPVVLMTRPANEYDANSIQSFEPFDLNAASGDNNNKNNISDHQKQSSSCSWTAYLKNKLLSSSRRGSNGSSASSSVSGDCSSRSGATGSGLNGISGSSHEAKSGSKKKKNASKNSSTSSSATMTETAVSSLRRRLNAKTWFETLSTRVREEKETVKPVPLPTFEDEFDDQDIQNLKGRKGKTGQKVGKKDLTSVMTSAVTAFPASSSSSTGTSTTSGSSSPIVTAVTSAPILAYGTLPAPIAAAREQLLLQESSSSSGGARTLPKTTSLIAPAAYGSSSFELPYNPGKGRRCESLSAVSSADPFVLMNGSYKDSPASDSAFGFWDPENGSSKSSATDNNMEIWDSPITMFDPQMALMDLSKKQAAAASSSKHAEQKKHSSDSSSGVSKSSLCAFTPSTVFPPVGLFDASLVHRPMQTPSPRGWSPSHKSLQASASMPVSSDITGNNRTTPSPISATTTASHLWEGEKDVLSRLRETSTDWIRGPAGRVATPVQRPHVNGSSPLWPDSVAPGGGRLLTEKTGTRTAGATNGMWPVTTDVMKLDSPLSASSSSPTSPSSSSWNPLSSGSSGFSLFGRSLWSPIPAPPPGIPSAMSPDSGWTHNNTDDRRH